MATETTQDAVELLTADHRKVDGLFAQIESSSGADKDEAVRQVTRELSIHAAIEEQIVYPVMRRSLPDGDAKVEEAIAEHQTVKETLAEIEHLGSSAERDHKLGSLMAGVRHHVEEEESGLFPELRAAVGDEELRAMGEKLAAAKKLAPTHPHPHAPATPPGNIVAGAAAAVVDKARDAVSRR
jgi:hemerythrin superfamily protein